MFLFMRLQLLPISVVLTSMDTGAELEKWRSAMKVHIILVSLMLGLQVVPVNARAESEQDHPASDIQNSGKRVAGTLWVEPKTGMEFVWVPTGCFQMGGDRSDAQPIHRVCVNGFWMGRHEVTQAQYEQIKHFNPSKFIGPNRPVEQISWHFATRYVESMSYITGTRVRLPSEAEWEYACRAGGAHKMYCGSGSDPGRLAWYDANSNGWPHDVGQLAPNDWGLYDMSGNVWEWTQDCYNKNYIGAPADGSAWESGDCSKRIYRGGAWYNNPGNLLAASRNNNDTDSYISNIGFRVVREIP